MYTNLMKSNPYKKVQKMVGSIRDDACNNWCSYLQSSKLTLSVVRTAPKLRFSGIYRPKINYEIEKTRRAPPSHQHTEDEPTVLLSYPLKFSHFGIDV